MANPDDLIGTSEAAELLDLDRSTFSRWVQVGRLHPVTKLPGVTGAFLFRRSDIEALRELPKRAS
jgi:excisionase family DNA binding protein